MTVAIFINYKRAGVREAATDIHCGGSACGDGMPANVVLATTSFPFISSASSVNGPSAYPFITSRVERGRDTNKLHFAKPYIPAVGIFSSSSRGRGELAGVPSLVIVEIKREWGMKNKMKFGIWIGICGSGGGDILREGSLSLFVIIFCIRCPEFSDF